MGRFTLNEILSQEDKDRILAEEQYRAQLRNELATETAGQQPAAAPQQSPQQPVQQETLIKPAKKISSARESVSNGWWVMKLIFFLFILFAIAQAIKS